MKDALDFTKHRTQKEASIKLANEDEICKFVSDILAIKMKYIHCRIMSDICIISISEEIWISKLIELYNIIEDYTMVISNNSIIVDYKKLSATI